MDAEEGRAGIWELDLETGASRIFASGLRNPVGMAWEGIAKLFGSDCERSKPPVSWRHFERVVGPQIEGIRSGMVA